MTLYIDDAKAWPKSVVVLDDRNYSVLVDDAKKDDQKLIEDPGILVIRSGDQEWHNHLDCYNCLMNSSENFKEQGVYVLEEDKQGKLSYRKFPIGPKDSQVFFDNLVMSEMSAKIQFLSRLARELGVQELKIEFQCSENYAKSHEFDIKSSFHADASAVDTISEQESQEVNGSGGSGLKVKINYSDSRSGYADITLLAQYKSSGYNLKEGIANARRMLKNSQYSDLAEFGDLIENRASKNKQVVYSFLSHYKSDMKKGLDALFGLSFSSSVSIAKIFNFKSAAEMSASINALKEGFVDRKLKISMVFHEDL